MIIQFEQSIFDFTVDEVAFRVFFTPTQSGHVHVKVGDMDNEILKYSENQPGDLYPTLNNAKKYLRIALGFPV